jgi:hypothetical protein
MTTTLRGAIFALVLTAASQTHAQPVASPPAPPEAAAGVPGAVDPDAQCLMLMRGYALGVRRTSSDAVGTWETAFSYYTGRLLARHRPEAITPLAAAALRADPPEADRYEAGQRCRAAALQLLTGPQAGHPPANAERPAADAPRDADAFCLRLMRVAFLSRMQAMQRGQQGPSGQTRGLMIATAYYTGRLAALRGEPAIERLTDAAYREGEPHAEIEAAATQCYGDGSRAAHAINLAIDAALPPAAPAADSGAEAPTGK